MLAGLRSHKCGLADRERGGAPSGMAERGRGTPGKAPLVAAIQCTLDGQPVTMRMDVLPGFRKTALTAWADQHLAKGAAVVSDGLSCFPDVIEASCTHVVIVSGSGVPEHPIFW